MPLAIVKLDPIRMTSIVDLRSARAALSVEQRIQLDSGSLIYIGCVESGAQLGLGKDVEPCGLVMGLIESHAIRHEAGDCHTASAALSKADDRVDHWRGYVISDHSIMAHSWNGCGDNLFIDLTMAQLREEMGCVAAPDIGIYRLV